MDPVFTKCCESKPYYVYSINKSRQGPWQQSSSLSPTTLHLVFFTSTPFAICVRAARDETRAQLVLFHYERGAGGMQR